MNSLAKWTTRPEFEETDTRFESRCGNEKEETRMDGKGSKK